MPRRPAKARDNPRWTPDEKRRLIEFWQTLTPAELAARVGHTVGATFAQAERMGLPTGVPRNHESVATAARRAGYSPQKFAKILAAHGVPVVPHWNNDGVRSSWGLVDAARAREAVVAHSKYVEATESIAEAAARLGVDAMTLGTWMAAAGMSGDRKHRRFDPAAVDALVAARRAAAFPPGLVSLDELEARHGHGRPLTLRILREAGVPVTLARRQHTYTARINLVDADAAERAFQAHAAWLRATETIPEAAARMGVHRGTLFHRVKTAKLKPLGAHGRAPRYDPRALDALTGRKRA